MKYLNKHKILNLFISTSPFLLLAIKSYPEIGLDGFPFNTKMESIFFIIFFFLFLNNNLDININSKIYKVLAIVLVLIVVLQYFVKDTSYKACYSTSETPISNFEMNFNVSQNCQFSFEKPFNKNLTNETHFINFNPNPQNNESIEYTNWNLYFFNQTGFNFYDKSFYGGKNDLKISTHWILDNGIFVRTDYLNYQIKKDMPLFAEYDYGFDNLILPIEPSRSWLSFKANWSSDQLSKFKDDIKIAYVGEVKLKVDNNVINLEPSYKKVSEYVINIKENSNVEIEYFYRFNGLINSIPNIPYASITVTDIENNPINIYENKQSNFFHLVITIMSAVFLFFYLIYFGYNLQQIFYSTIFIATIYLVLNFLPVNFVDIFEISILFLTICFAVYKSQYRTSYYLIAIFSLTYSSIKNLNLQNEVLYAVGGSDPLKYESWSQQIIYFMSLRGGEDIFLYQPGYRYLLSLLHLVFGDSHFSIVLFSRFLFVYLIFKLFLYLLSVYENQKLFISFNFILSYIFLSTYSSKLNLFSSLSEWPTWILGLIFLNIFLKLDFNFKNIFAMYFLLGACFFVRENQFPGLIYLVLLIFFLAENKKVFLKPITIFGFFLLLPFLHNFIYGGEFILEKNIFRSDVFYLSPFDLIFNFQSVYDKFLFQFNYLIANPLNDGVRIMSGKIFPITVSLIIIQFLIIFVIRRKNLINFMYFIVPFAFLGPHLFYQVHTYFPRHIIQGYLFMIASTLLINLNSKNSIQ